MLRLQSEVSEERDHVRVPGALAVTVDRRLHVAHTGVDRRERIRHSKFGVVMRVDSPHDLFRRRVSGEGCTCILHDLSHAAREGAAIGVAENEGRCPSVTCGAQRVERIVAICFIAIKEVLGVIDHLATALGDVGDALRDHREVLGARRL